jgi:hypothetical protein
MSYYYQSSSSSSSSSSYSRSTSSYATSSSSRDNQLMNMGGICSASPSLTITSRTIQSPMVCTGSTGTHGYYRARSVITTSQPWYQQLSHTYTTGRITSNVGTLVVDEAPAIVYVEQQKRAPIKSIQQEHGKITSKSLL